MLLTSRVAQTLRRSASMSAPRRCWFSTVDQKITSGGFSYPAPRSLQQIVKLELLENESKEQIEKIWTDYHSAKDDSIATAVSGENYKTFVQRASASPFFLFPVYRKEGFFNMICQFQDTCFLLTYLEAFKENPGLAPPCLTVSLYDNLVESKDIGLLRADVINMLDKKESQVLLDQLLASYLDEKLFQWVHKFNHEPEQFDFEAYRLAMQNFTAPPSTFHPQSKRSSIQHKNEELQKKAKHANMTLSAPSLPHDDDHRDFAHMFSHLHLHHSQIHAPAPPSQFQQQHDNNSNNNNNNGMYVPPGSDNDTSTAFGFMDQHQQQPAPTSVHRVSREVENIGARVPMSKKRISWRFVLAGFDQVHTVTLEHSRITAKKRLRLDGRRLFNSEQYCAGDWKYDFQVEEHAPRFTVVIKDVKATVVDQHSLAGIYQLHVDGYAWEQLPERVFAGAVKRRFTNPVWSSDKFARRVSDETFDLQHSNQQPGTGHAWVIAFGVLGTIHKLELWDSEEGEFVVVLDCRELARVKHDDIEEDSWEYEYTLANQHELVLTVTLEDEGKRYDFSIDGSPWRDISETEFVLQPGWFPVYSRSKGTAYFRNHATSETRWEKPIMSRNGSTIIEQIPSQDLKPTVSPVHKHEDAAAAAQYNSFSSNQLEFQPSPSSPPAPLGFQQETEVNLLDFSEISVHSSPTHAQQQSSNPINYASFDPFDPVYQSTAQHQQQSPPPAQYQQQQQQKQQFQQSIDLLS